MNEEIKKFWEKEKVNCAQAADGSTYYYYVVMPGYRCVSVAEYRKNVWRYFFNGKWHSEKRMLKIIRLKAFL